MKCERSKVEFLSRRVRFDPATGRFEWLERAPLTRWDKIFNARFAGTEPGSVNTSGHIKIGFKMDGELCYVLAHRLAWFVTFGRLPVDELDHINHDPSDNRIVNLREVSHADNCKNQKMRSTNTSGVMGVHSTRGKWRAQGMRNGKNILIGDYPAIELAISAVNSFYASSGYHANHGARAALAKAGVE